MEMPSPVIARMNASSLSAWAGAATASTAIAPNAAISIPRSQRAAISPRVCKVLIAAAPHTKGSRFSPERGSQRWFAIRARIFRIATTCAW
jgi:hypothetical protein